MGLSITVNGFMTIPQYGQHVAVSGPSLFWFAIKASRREFGSFPASTCFSISWNCIRGFSMSCSFFCYVQVLASHSVCVCTLLVSVSICQSLLRPRRHTRTPRKSVECLGVHRPARRQSTRICQKAVKIQVYTNIYIILYIYICIHMYIIVYRERESLHEPND